MEHFMVNRLFSATNRSMVHAVLIRVVLLFIVTPCSARAPKLLAGRLYKQNYFDDR